MTNRLATIAFFAMTAAGCTADKSSGSDLDAAAWDDYHIHESFQGTTVLGELTVFGPFLADEGGMMATGFGQNNLEVYVSRGEVPDFANYDCLANDGGGVNECELDGVGHYFVAVSSNIDGATYILDVDYGDPVEIALDENGDVSLALNSDIYSPNNTVSGDIHNVVDGVLDDSWMVEPEPVAHQDVVTELYLELKAAANPKTLILDWVPGTEPESVEVFVNVAGAMVAIGRTAVQGRRTEVDLNTSEYLLGDESELKIWVEGDGEDGHAVGFRQVWVW